MSGPAGLLSLLKRLFRHVTPRRRFQLTMLLGITAASSAAEVLSLGAVVPFIGMLTEPDRVMTYAFAGRLIRAFGLSSVPSLVLALTVAFSGAALLAGGLRLLLLWLSIRLTNETGVDLSVEVYRRTLFQPYSVHVARSSSKIISGITQKVNNATGVLMSLVTVITSAALFGAILATLLAIDPWLATTSMIGFGISYGVIAWLTRHRLKRNSECIAREQTTVIKALQEGLGAIRDVLLDGTQAVYTAVYADGVRKLQRASGENSYITQAPRFAMETLAMLLLAALAYSMRERQNSVGAVLPVLGALVLGAQRLLPLLQQLYGNWAVVAGSQGALVDVLGLLEQPLPDDAVQPQPEPLAFREAIVFDRVRFRYSPNGPWVLDGLSLRIPVGSRVGLVGTTGSGKSTALDLLMALMDPTEGQILVDGRPIVREVRRAWQRAIAHVPQSIFLADASVAQNIAFGVPIEQIDHARIREAARRAQIAEFIEDGAEGYRAMVGERGIRLSGGQRQRIGIARALYKEASVLVFDEATSALDGATEEAVMDAIEGLDRDLTILIVAHRLTTLKGCDTVVKLERGRVGSKGSFEEFSHARSFDRQEWVRT